MKELVEYIAEILNIKTESELVVLDMIEETQSIKDIADYRKFIKQYLNHIDVQYMTGFQKFIKLTALYKSHITKTENAERLKGAKGTAQKLAEKVKSVSRCVIDNNELDCDNFKLTGGTKDYFDSFEIKQINKQGGLLRCVGLQNSKSGSDPLLDAFEKSMEEIVITKTLNNPERQVAGLLCVKKF